MWKIFSSFALLLLLAACSTSLPEEHHKVFPFPEKHVYVELPTGPDANRPYETLGWVRTKVHYPTMEQDPNNLGLCRNYYNKGAAQLLKEAKKVGGEAVVQIRSVVMMMDRTVQEYPTPECSDDGAEGEILLKGIAIKFKKIEKIDPTKPISRPTSAP